MCLSSMHATPLLGILVTQLIAAPKLPGDALSDARRANIENVLLALLDHGNKTQTQLAKIIGKRKESVVIAVSHLIEARMAYTWRAGIGRAKAVWFGLTPLGVKRAKELKEMGE